jgi:adenylosuccinate synthase
VAHRYALEVCGGVDGLALTHLDLAASSRALRLVRSYDIMDRIEPGPFRDLGYQARMTARLVAARPLVPAEPPEDWVGAVQDALATPVVVTSAGPTTADKREVALDVTV